jgi:dTDP-4-amino-4,6-dideoxygalactose transaminase
VDVLRSGVPTQGPAVEVFEQAIAKYVGAQYAIAVSSGAAALHLAALAAGVGPSTSLTTSTITFVASAICWWAGQGGNPAQSERTCTRQKIQTDGTIVMCMFR